ncbi:LPS translocon maturation chaperone LptM [Achromobacter deleyi]|uniref:LPS translocon maturation chaperone LptM n=1 Tax=Achromobacter deleyi TaxID=1353891 RepID=UPI003B3ABDFF
MLFSTWSINARNSDSVIIEPARITEFPVFQLAFSRMSLRIVATLLATGMVAACGYKGPLYMPTPDGKPPPPGRGQTTPQVPQIPATPSLP